MNGGRPGRTGEANMYSTNNYNAAGYHLHTWGQYIKSTLNKERAQIHSYQKVETALLVAGATRSKGRLTFQYEVPGLILIL